MAIPFTNYVDITSGVIAAPAVTDRSLSLRLFSTNRLVPTNSFAEFTSAEDVGDHFGFTSDEYNRAAFYFGFISKVATAPRIMSIASWVENNTAPILYGSSKSLASLASFAAIAAGNLNLTIGEVTAQMNFNMEGNSASYASIAATIQGGIRVSNPADPDWTNATVVYDSVNGRFVLTGSEISTGQAIPISCNPCAAPDLGSLLGWQAVDAIASAGAPAEDLVAAVYSSAQASNNFGSFAFVPTLTQDQIMELASLLADTNYLFMALFAVNADNASEISAALIGSPVVPLLCRLCPTNFLNCCQGQFLLQLITQNATYLKTICFRVAFLRRLLLRTFTRYTTACV